MYVDPQTLPQLSCHHQVNLVADWAWGQYANEGVLAYFYNYTRLVEYKTFPFVEPLDADMEPQVLLLRTVPVCVQHHRSFEFPS